MRIKTYVIDSFTDEPFKGNPAGVCLPDEPLTGKLMQSIAAEINAPETAFVTKHADKDSTYNIRYFSPTVEVAFCGHASFAAARLLLELNNADRVNFITAYGRKISAAPANGKVSMRFPLFKLEPYEIAPELTAAMGIEKYWTIGFNAELAMLLVELPDKQALLNLDPDFAAMLKADENVKEVVVTAWSEDGLYDIYSRCFCPWIGIDEDPVTGAAHSVLTGFWNEKTGRTKFTAYQCSVRGGYLDLQLLDDDVLEVTSNARIIMEGTISV